MTDKITALASRIHGSWSHDGESWDAMDEDERMPWILAAEVAERHTLETIQTMLADARARLAAAMLEDRLATTLASERPFARLVRADLDIKALERVEAMLRAVEVER